MSGSDDEITNTEGPGSSGEPSMEEILASIRRILRDEETGEPNPQAEPEDEDILVLDSSMVVRPMPAPSEPAAAEPPDAAGAEAASAETSYKPAEAAPAHLTSQPAALDFPAVENQTLDLPAPETEERMEETQEPAVVLTDTGVAGTAEEIFMPEHDRENVRSPDGLVSDAASHAAASSIGSLIRSISSERSIAIGRPGLTLEDLVREELRPLLKSWLDSNLPSLVERIVRAEIQRVVERSNI